jgi:thymidylate kinase
MMGVGTPRGRLIAVEGISGAGVAAEARRVLRASGRARGGVSWWDASGLFEQLAASGEERGAPSPRTLLLLYAADLAFRLRWEIEPAIAEGKTVVAAPYIATAVAFGRAAGLTGGWLLSLFRFAPAPAMRSDVAVRLRSGAAPRGFVEVSARLAGGVLGLTRRQLIERAQARLKRL